MLFKCFKCYNRDIRKKCFHQKIATIKKNKLHQLLIGCYELLKINRSLSSGLKGYIFKSTYEAFLNAKKAV